MARYGPQHKYIGFIDSDEYIVLRGKYANDTIDSFLLRFDDAPGVVLNWYFVGSGQPIHRPKGLVGCNFVDCVPNRHVKSFCSTKFTERQQTMHECRFHSKHSSLGLRSVNVLGRQIDGPFDDNFTSSYESYDAVIYHYVAKSLDDFIRKNARGAGNGSRKPFDFFEHITKSISNGVGRCPIIRDAMTARGLCSDAPSTFKVATAKALKRAKKKASKFD